MPSWRGSIRSSRLTEVESASLAAFPRSASHHTPHHVGVTPPHTTTMPHGSHTNPCFPPTNLPMSFQPSLDLWSAPTAPMAVSGVHGTGATELASAAASTRAAAVEDSRRRAGATQKEAKTKSTSAPTAPPAKASTAGISCVENAPAGKQLCPCGSGKKFIKCGGAQSFWTSRRCGNVIKKEKCKTAGNGLETRGSNQSQLVNLNTGIRIECQDVMPARVGRGGINHIEGSR